MTGAGRLGLASAAALLALSAAVAAGAGAEPVQGKHLSVELVSSQSALVPGSSTTLGLNWKLEPGWHIYWSNAGDSGEPPDAKWNLPEGITAVPLQFPAPRRLPLGPLMDFGYEDQVLFPVAVNVASGVKAGTDAKLSADLRWLVCREVCLPGKGTVTLTLPVAASSGPTGNAALFADAAAKLPKALPAGVTVAGAQNAKAFFLEVTTGRAEKSAQFFPLDQNQVANAEEQPVVSTGKGLLIALPKDTNIEKTPSELHGVLELPDGRNYAVSTGVSGAVSSLPDGDRAFAATLGAVGAASAAAGAAAGRGAAPPGTHTITLNVGETIRVVLLAFVGGVILNLMPCVFPVLFLKGLSLVQHQGQERRESMRHGVLYTLGILVSFWAIAGALLVLRSGGAALGWGFQFQQPIFVAVVAMLLFFFGLSLAGQFDIGLTLTSAGGSLATRQGAAGSFFTGVLATVVATPCTAPFMGAAIGFALAQSALVSLLIFTSIALGLAAPYVLLTLAPQWTRFLPAPGAWMEVLKQASSVPIFATVIWLTWLFARLSGIDQIIDLLAALLLLAVAGWALGRWPARRGSALAAVLLIVAAIAVPVHGSRAAKKVEWQPWTQAAVDQARAAGKPVFVDFTAAWCLSCQFNEKAVLQSRPVEEALDQANVVRLRADWTKYDAPITEALATLGRQGVPTYVVYPGNPSGPPDVLPEALTQGEVLHALQQVGKGGK